MTSIRSIDGAAPAPRRARRGIPVRRRDPPSSSPPCRCSARRPSSAQAMHRPRPALAAAAADTYTWKNVRIDGGGFVPGIVFNRAEKNLIYARTDIGGAYRWNQAGQQLDPAARLGGPGQLGLQRRAQHRHRPGRPEPGVRGGRHVHQQLGPEQRRHPALHRPRRHLAGHQAAVQERRQHARPRHGRAARRRPARQPQRLLRRRGRQRPVAQHRLRRHLGQGHRVPERRQLRAGPGRPQRLPEPEPGPDLGHLRRRQPRRLRRRGGQAEPGLPLRRRRRHLGPDPRPADRIPGAQGRGDRATTSTSRPATPAARTTAARARSGGSTRTTGDVDRHQPDAAPTRRLLRLLRADRGPAESRHADGRHPDLLVAGRDLLPQHRQRRHLDPDLGLHRLSEPSPSATRWTSRRTRGWTSTPTRSRRRPPRSSAG